MLNFTFVLLYCIYCANFSLSVKRAKRKKSNYLNSIQAVDATIDSTNCEQSSVAGESMHQLPVLTDQDYSVLSKNLKKDGIDEDFFSNISGKI